MTRLGVVLEPNGDAAEAEGVLNPGAARTRDGILLLYPRIVAAGNCSSIGVVEVGGDAAAPVYRRVGLALRPEAPYELRDARDGQGCEDPRVTYVALLDVYVMAYTAFGPQGPRIALALSSDGYEWQRLGLVDFSAAGLPPANDKDAAFFPGPVRSPAGVLSFAMYHRPVSQARESFGSEEIRIAYVPLEPAVANTMNLLSVSESIIVAKAVGEWSSIKSGAGTPPIPIAEGLLSVFHGVDRIVNADGTVQGRRYSAGLLLHDAEQPHRIKYRSPDPLFMPHALEERSGIVNDVVFPTGIDVDGAGVDRSFDVYYGMADLRVGRVRVELGAGVPEGAASLAVCRPSAE